jgi:hypothetical protein
MAKLVMRMDAGGPPPVTGCVRGMSFASLLLGERHQQNGAGHGHADRHDRADKRLHVKVVLVTNSTSATPEMTAAVDTATSDSRSD